MTVSIFFPVLVAKDQASLNGSLSVNLQSDQKLEIPLCMITFIDRHDNLTVCKLHFEALFIPRHALVWPTMHFTKKLTGMRDKETYMPIYT